MKKKTWKIIVRHLVLALLAIIWLIPIVWLRSEEHTSELSHPK